MITVTPRFIAIFCKSGEMEFAEESVRKIPAVVAMMREIRKSEF
jgi:hypothetical protein